VTWAARLDVSTTGVLASLMGCRTMAVHLFLIATPTAYFRELYHIVVSLNEPKEKDREAATFASSMALP